MNIQLIVSDLDDSLLNEKSELSERTIAAVKRCREAGAEIMLASGRMAQAMVKFARQLDVTLPLIAFNGAETVDPATMQLIDTLRLEQQVAVEVCRFCEENGLYVHTYDGDSILVAQECERAREYLRCMTASAHLQPTNVPLSEYLEKYSPDGVPKLLIIDEPERIAQLLPVLRSRLEGRASCFISRPIYLEITSPQSSKGSALRRQSEKLGIPLENMAAFGDGINDLPMLEIVGFGCTMANAKEEVQKAVAHIAPSNREDGVAQVLEQLLEQGLIGKGV